MTGIADQDVTTTTYSAREQQVVAALTHLRVQGPDADEKARAKDRLMLMLTADQPARGAASIAS